MKKNLFTIMLAFFVVFGVNAQNAKLNSVLSNKTKRVYEKTGGESHVSTYRTVKGVEFSDDFEGGDLSNFTVINNGDANGFVWRDTDGHNGPACAAISYSSDAHDDWLITPAITASSSSYIKFWAKNQSTYFQEEFDVMLSTTGTNASDFTVTLASSVAPGTDYELEQYDLSAYDGQTVYVGIHITTTNEWRLYLDEFEIGSLDPHDLATTAVTPSFVLSGNTVTPQVTIHNNGSSNEATWSVTLSDGGSYTSTKSDVSTINSGADLVVDMDDWTPADGDYTLQAVVTLTGDADNSNDTVNQDVTVGTGVYSPDVYSYDASGTNINYTGTIDYATGTFTPLVNPGTGDFLAAGEYINGVVYGFEYGTNNVYVVTADGNAYQTGTLNGLSSVTGFAYDKVNDVMYASSYDGTNSNLYTVDASWNCTLVGMMGSELYIGIACDAAGNLYGIEMTNDNFASIDKSTGAATVIGPLGVDINYAQDIGGDSNSGTIYGTLYTSEGVFGTIDVTTGTFTQISSLSDEVTMCAVVPAAPTYNVTFNCNINDSITSGYFTAGTDTLSVTGSFAGWTEPGTDASLFMTDTDGDGIYTYTATLANGTYEYKYFKNAGWSNGEWNGNPNRTFTVADADLTIDDVFGKINVSVNEISKEGINVFPNPSNGVFNINVENNYNLEVFDITGRVINTRTLTGNTTLELNNAGIYFLRFSNKNGSYTQKVIVR